MSPLVTHVPPFWEAGHPSEVHQQLRSVEAKLKTFGACEVWGPRQRGPST